MSKTFLLLWIFVCSISGFGNNEAVEISGAKLPKLVKAALEAVENKFEWFDPVSNEIVNEKIRLNLKKVVLIKNMSEFCRIRSINETDCIKFGEAFVLNNSYPIYLTGDPSTNSSYQRIENLSLEPTSAIHYLLAGILIHEDFHARGYQSEIMAYSRESGFIKTMQSKGILGNQFWVSRYLQDIQKNISISFSNDERLNIRMAKSYLDTGPHYF